MNESTPEGALVFSQVTTLLLLELPVTAQMDGAEVNGATTIKEATLTGLTAEGTVLITRIL
jgi:hypothetical protein